MLVAFILISSCKAFMPQEQHNLSSVLPLSLMWCGLLGYYITNVLIYVSVSLSSTLGQTGTELTVDQQTATSALMCQQQDWIPWCQTGCCVSLVCFWKAEWQRTILRIALCLPLLVDLTWSLFLSAVTSVQFSRIVNHLITASIQVGARRIISFLTSIHNHQSLTLSRQRHRQLHLKYHSVVMWTNYQRLFGFTPFVVQM